jgi:uncharacterized protein
VYTTFQGRLGAVDERLIDEGRLRVLDDEQQLRLPLRGGAGGHDRDHAAVRVRRDPRVLVELLLSALDGR